MIVLLSKNDDFAIGGSLLAAIAPMILYILSAMTLVVNLTTGMPSLRRMLFFIFFCFGAGVGLEAGAAAFCATDFAAA